ncbi:MAG: MarR family transcriptional regulator, partial [Lysinibacillus sp.]
LFESISALERQVANEWNSRNDLGFSKSHIKILELLATEGPKRPSALADQLQVTTGGVTVLTTKLLKSGYIEKTPNEIDRRAAQITITADGLEVLQSSKSHINSLAENLFGNLSNDEINLLHQLFQKCLK